MTKVIKKIELRLVDPANNHNKFYQISLTDDESVITQWGKIGSKKPQQQIRNYQGIPGAAKSCFEQLIKEKEKKGYKVYEKTKAITQEENTNKVKTVSPQENQYLKEPTIKYKTRKLYFD